ncbi:MAG: hypothetical protein JSS09_01255, partial [Verrucomicrobia bacterium]|nr:hypothetical protein [Verrucomicrobiota bacterium]
KIKALKDRIVKYLQKKNDLSKGAFYRLASFLGKCDLNEWHPESPTALAEWCICAQMTDFPMDKALSCFDLDHFVFIGKTKDRLQEGFEPAVTLLDLFMGEYFGEFSARSLLLHPIHLRASIVYPFTSKAKKKDSPYTVLIEEEKRQCFTLYFGDKSYTNSLTVEAKKGSWKIIEEKGSLFKLFYTPDESSPSEEDSVECALYVSAHKDVSLAVNGVSATAFHENDLLSITTASKVIGVKFSANKGTWIGHISKANRSFQRKLDGYAVYDWKIGWRTLRRSSDAQVEIEINISNIS